MQWATASADSSKSHDEVAEYSASDGISKSVSAPTPGPGSTKEEGMERMQPRGGEVRNIVNDTAITGMNAQVWLPAMGIKARYGYLHKTC